MSENPIAISSLNDFLFCPVSIYFHNLESEENILYQDTAQINGTHSHKSSDNAAYSTRKSMLQGVSIYCRKYNLCGKIDVFDIDTGVLTERKKLIKNVYDGYIFQLYAQYFSLKEMGYTVNSIRLYSIDTNKIYNIDLPENSPETMDKFIKLLSDINTFSFDDFKQNNKEKCNSCIYEPLCSFSISANTPL